MRGFSLPRQVHCWSGVFESRRLLPWAESVWFGGDGGGGSGATPADGCGVRPGVVAALAAAAVIAAAEAVVEKVEQVGIRERCKKSIKKLVY